MEIKIPANWTQGDVLVKEAPLHYYRTGDGSKPSLILQHGFSDDGLCWLQTALDLEADYDILMPDARGHGLSARVTPGEKIDMASDLAEIIRLLALQKPIVAGHSMGAGIAGQIGSRFPDLPRAIILEDPPYRLVSETEAHAAPQVREHPMSGFVKSLASQTTDQLMQQARTEHPDWPEVVIQTWCSAKKRLDPNILTTSSLNYGDWQDVVKKITCPVLLFTADPGKGGIVNEETARVIQRLNPNISIVNIPGVGHHIRFGNYAPYMQAFRSFLAGL